ncbi:hypothetical protein IC617_08360 [Neiella sp. HB171785]|uniref:Uncharacterized protein n=1 Tax=Neiella litorisoli TaxID=2771431 RepID=A0A8J6QU46_9GAMM|nr:hypothetical protein [Neiella litorisoli]MBD1389437.1 hypothetical protein [Neiella litorisoli]
MSVITVLLTGGLAGVLGALGGFAGRYAALKCAQLSQFDSHRVTSRTQPQAPGRDWISNYFARTLPAPFVAGAICALLFHDASEYVRIAMSMTSGVVAPTVMRHLATAPFNELVGLVELLYKLRK